MALWQLFLDFAITRRNGKWFRGLMMAGKLLLWLLYFLLLGSLGVSRLLWGGLSALGLYTVMVILFLLFRLRKGEESK